MLTQVSPSELEDALMAFQRCLCVDAWIFQVEDLGLNSAITQSSMRINYKESLFNKTV